MRRRDERGSGTVYVLAIAVLLSAVAALAAGFGALAVAKHRAASAADLAALAGAAQLSQACEVATDVAVRNAARLSGCAVEGVMVSVTVTASTPMMLGYSADVPARARAGPAHLRW